MMKVVLLFVGAFALAKATECSHTTCSFVSTAMGHIMRINHNNDETECHTFSQTQNSDGSWLRKHTGLSGGALNTANHIFTGVHCGATNTVKPFACKCYKHGTLKADKDGKMKH